MFHIPKWKIILSAIVCIYAIFVLLGNFSNADNKAKLNLGLDLRGGAYLLLEINHEAYFQEKTAILQEEVRSKLRAERIGYSNLSIVGDKIKFNIRNVEENLVKALRSISTDIDIEQSGMEVTINYNADFIKNQKIKLLEQSVEIIRKRVDESGTKEPLIQPQGLNRVILQVPGLSDPERLKQLLGKTAKLTFQMVNQEKPVVDDLFYQPEGYKILPSNETQNDRKLYYLVSDKIEISGEALIDAQASIFQGSPQINFTFDNRGGRKFGELTSASVGRYMAIILDGIVISAPVIREPILGGKGVISGNFTPESANDLAVLLRAGSLPAPLEIIEERTVGPTLGQDSIAAGKQAVIIGFIAVLLLILIIYRKFGVFAFLALLMNIVFIFAALTALGAALTLPGIAGIVLTIGMAVDTNVLIFERIREESRSSKSIYAVIDQGFNQALKTIMDSNITTLIAALILFNFGSGPVKGFAVTLSIGILASIFSAIFLTKILIYLWIKKSKPKKIEL